MKFYPISILNSNYTLSHQTKLWPYLSPLFLLDPILGHLLLKSLYLIVLKYSHADFSSFIKFYQSLCHSLKKNANPMIVQLNCFNRINCSLFELFFNWMFCQYNQGPIAEAMPLPTQLKKKKCTHLYCFVDCLLKTNRTYDF